jgi:hypothetical protein
MNIQKTTVVGSGTYTALKNGPTASGEVSTK